MGFTYLAKWRGAAGPFVRRLLHRDWLYTDMFRSADSHPSKY